MNDKSHDAPPCLHENTAAKVDFSTFVRIFIKSTIHLAFPCLILKGDNQHENPACYNLSAMPLSFRSFIALINVCSLLLSSLLPLISEAASVRFSAETRMTVCSTSTNRLAFTDSNTALPKGHGGDRDCQYCCQAHALSSQPGASIHGYFHRAWFVYATAITLTPSPSPIFRENNPARAPPASALS